MFEKYIEDKKNWLNILETTKERNRFQKKKIKAYEEIIETDIYKNIISSIKSEKYTFSPPRKVKINKFNSIKKKTVYIFNFQDDLVLKILNSYLNENFSHLISPNCHSFQKNKGAKTAFKSILSDKKINTKYTYKTDISNFFNSIDVKKFFKILPIEIKNNTLIFNILQSIFFNNIVFYKGKKIFDNKKGLMAGNPLAPFLSNIYLNDIDNYFYTQNITYARYSDDIIFFDNLSNINKHIKFLESKISTKNLAINKEKTIFLEPGKKWTFLGFSYKQGQIDISEASVEKLKIKVRRLSKRYNRLLSNNKFTENQILTFFIKKLNNKFFGLNRDYNDLCWSKWYFPLINTDRSLKIIDKFIQERMRYAITGHFRKLNYSKVPYHLLKSLGYKTLTNSYYLFKYDFEKFNNLFRN